MANDRSSDVDELRKEFISSTLQDPWIRVLMEMSANAWVNGYRSAQDDVGRLNEEDCTSGLIGTSVAEAIRFLDESSNRDLMERAMREIAGDKDRRDFVGATAQVARALNEAKALAAEREVRSVPIVQWRCDPHDGSSFTIARVYMNKDEVYLSVVDTQGGRRTEVSLYEWMSWRVAAGSFT